MQKYDSFALKDVTFSVPKGFISGFIGQNGAGKTTTIKSILNIINADSGSITLFGKENTIESNKGVGVVMDAPMYVEAWTVADVEKALKGFYPDWDSEKYDRYTKKFNLDKTKKVKDLSRGMKVKLQISVALSHNAQFLLLDEPTSGLDPVARDEICNLLREFVEDDNRSVFFSTHITTDLEKTADYITFILNGEIAFSGAKDDLLNKYVRVSGGLQDIQNEHKDLIIGYRERSMSFEGMIETDNVRNLPKSVLAEEITIDEIIVYMSKGETNE